MDQTAMERLERQINTEVKARFPAGPVQRVTLLHHGDDPGELLVRVFIGAGDGPAGGHGPDVAYRRALEHVLPVTALPPIAAEARDALAALPTGLPPG